VKTELPVVAAAATTTTAAATVEKKVVVKKKKAVASVISENVENIKVEEPAPVETVTETATTTTTTVATTEPVEDKLDKKRVRRQVTKESFYNDTEALFKTIETEFADKKSFIKVFKQLKTDAFKLLKIRNMGEDRKKGENSTSGFMKPVSISDDLAGFIGVNNEEPITRVLITKKICQHIKEKDLQNPKDRREIIPDAALRKLFAITDADKEPLTYYGIQKRIQRHIFKTPAPVATA
jgi:chromatin remodeling complex protein RSC6